MSTVEIESIIISTMMMFFAIVSCLVILHTFNHLCQCQKSNVETAKQIRAFFRYTSLCAGTSFCIVCVSATIGRILSFVYTEQQIAMIHGIEWLFYFVGRMVLSLIFVGRLDFTFRGTVFQYTKYTMYYLKGTWSLMAFSALLCIVLGSAAYNTDFAIFIMIFGTLCILADVVLGVTLIYLYSKKLFILISKYEQELMPMMIRYSLLYSICFMSSFAALMIFLVQVITRSQSGYDIMSLFLSIDSLTNMMCVWLSYRFAERWYWKLCAHCDGKCKSCYEGCLPKHKEAEEMIEKEIQAPKVSNESTGTKDIDVCVKNSIRVVHKTPEGNSIVAIVV